MKRNQTTFGSPLLKSIFEACLFIGYIQLILLRILSHSDLLTLLIK